MCSTLLGTCRDTARIGGVGVKLPEAGFMLSKVLPDGIGMRVVLGRSS